MEAQEHEGALLVYFTDGYGVMPEHPARQELLWILEDGIEPECFSFGQVIHLNQPQ